MATASHVPRVYHGAPRCVGHVGDPDKTHSTKFLPHLLWWFLKSFKNYVDDSFDRWRRPCFGGKARVQGNGVMGTVRTRFACSPSSKVFLVYLEAKKILYFWLSQTLSMSEVIHENILKIYIEKNSHSMKKRSNLRGADDIAMMEFLDRLYAPANQGKRIFMNSLYPIPSPIETFFSILLHFFRDSRSFFNRFYVQEIVCFFIARLKFSLKWIWCNLLTACSTS